MISRNLVINSGNFTLRPLRTTDIDAFGKLTADASMWTYFTSDLSEFNTLVEWVKEGIEETAREKRIALNLVDKFLGMPLDTNSLFLQYFEKGMACNKNRI